MGTLLERCDGDGEVTIGCVGACIGVPVAVGVCHLSCSSLALSCIGCVGVTCVCPHTCGYCARAEHLHRAGRLGGDRGFVHKGEIYFF